MSLVPDYENSSDSSSSSSDSAEEEDRRPQETKHSAIAVTKNERLPLPGFAADFVDEPRPPLTSVFKNPFVEEENAKKAMLEKHVKMVSNAKVEAAPTINGKKVCWNYRKGKCRFGHNCVYAHDSDLQKTEEQLEAENRTQRQTVSQRLPQPTAHELQKIKEESAANSGKKRKRPGLTQGLVPGKKVMSKYLHQKK